jgi:sugar phosphate isomerase/epimerase
MLTMMQMSFITDALGYMPFEEMLDTVAGLGFEAVELGCGNWSKAPHVPLDELLESKTARDRFVDAIHSRGLDISALNCSGHQLAPNASGEAHKRTLEKTFRLAGLLGVKTIVMMSGCPGAGPNESEVHWVTSVFFPEHERILAYQWNEVFFPYWEKSARLARECGIEKVALENHHINLVYNAATLKKMRAVIDPIVGMNFDPSHLMWMGGDPIAALRALGKESIHYMHAKDVRLERGIVDLQGVIDQTPMSDAGNRAWNYVALGHGHDVSWWKEFYSVARYIGYEGPVMHLSARLWALRDIP